jgi:hypothetical protein
VVGAACLAWGARPTVDAGAGAAAATTTTTTVPGQATTTTTAPAVRPSTAVKVLVANGGTVNGAAGYFTQKLKSDGWGTLTPTTATSQASSSVVYYAAGNSGPAKAIATALGLPDSDVQPLGSSTPVRSTAGADVVLVVGSDLATQVTTTASSTSSSTTSATSTSTATTTTTTTTPTASAG